MLIGRGAGGPKQSKWKNDSKKAFVSYFGKRSGGEPLPAGPPDAAESDVETAVELASVELNGSEWRRQEAAAAAVLHAPAQEDSRGRTPFQSAASRAVSSSSSSASQQESDGGLPPPLVASPLELTAVAWDSDGRATEWTRVEARSPVPKAGDERLIEALIVEALHLDAPRPPGPETEVDVNTLVQLWHMRSEPLATVPQPTQEFGQLPKLPGMPCRSRRALAFDFAAASWHADTTGDRRCSSCRATS